jgi:hypothetical protein
MAPALAQHTTRLGMVAAAMVASVGAYGALVSLLPAPAAVPIAQGSTLLWFFALLAALNLVTLTPVYRAMLAGPLRVFAVGRELRPLLAAHFLATVVAFARLEAVALLGLLLFLLAGHRDWFWGFAGVAIVGMLAVWPSPGRVREHLGLGADV